MRSSIILVFCLFALFTGKDLAQVNNPDGELYQFNGKIIETESDSSGSSIILKMKMEFEVKNASNKNLIFWNRDTSETMGEAKIVRVVISKNETFAEQDIIRTNFWEPSDFYGKSWEELRTSLDKPFPPDNRTIVIEPNKSWVFSLTTTMVIDKNEIVSPKSQLSNIWIKVHYKSWSPNIEPKSKYRATDIVFGKMLQKRWESYGNLILESLVSKPIIVDLNSNDCENRLKTLNKLK